jgi:hypothetical protein
MSIPSSTIPVDKQQAQLIAHLQAAGGRPVSFDELRSLGIENPAVLCYELDLVGVPVTRVYHYPAPGHAVPVGVRIEPGETPPEVAERQGPSEGLAPTDRAGLGERIGRTERIAMAAGIAATRRFRRSAVGLAPTRRFIRTKPIVSREPGTPADAIGSVEEDGARAAGARAAPDPRAARTRAAPGPRAARTRAAPGLRAALASAGQIALFAHLGRLLGEHGRVRARAREAGELVRARAHETRERAGARANAAVAAGTGFARRGDSRVLAGAIALTVLAAVGVALALAGGSTGPRSSFAAVRGAVRAEGRAPTGAWRLQGAGWSSSRGGDSAARRSAREKAAASRRAGGGGAARTGTQAGSEHAVAGSALTATQLEARGHKLLGEGHYAAAIGDFRAALAATGQSSARCGVPGSEACLTYAYALYDLGRALRLAGKPRAAVPVLTKRLRINNQRGTVKNELGLAKKAHGNGGVAAPSPKTQRPKKAPAPPAQTPTGPTGQSGPTGSSGPSGSSGASGSSGNSGATGT